MISEYDSVVFGSGIFGMYAALLEARRGRVVIVDSAADLMAGSSSTNQLRLHSGMHYPRSRATAVSCQRNYHSFLGEFPESIRDDFVHFYGIERHGSLSSPRDIERLAQYAGIELEEVRKPPSWCSNRRIEALFKVREPVIVPGQLRRTLSRRLEDAGIVKLLGTRLQRGHANQGAWKLSLRQESKALRVEAARVINATYGNLNEIQAALGLAPLSLHHELAEICVVHAPILAGSALTIVDGPFASITPFGQSRLHLLSSVVYTHHASDSSGTLPFPCQSARSGCSPLSQASCQTCHVRPASNFRWMRNQIGLYLEPGAKLTFHSSQWTVKTLWNKGDEYDGRPSSIVRTSENPPAYAVLSGKMSGIYDLEVGIDAIP